MGPKANWLVLVPDTHDAGGMLIWPCPLLSLPLRSGRLPSMEYAQSLRAVNSCLAKRPLPIILLPFPLPSSASRRLRSLEVGKPNRGQVDGRQWLAEQDRACCGAGADVSIPLLSIRLQGGHHHTAHADAAEGPAALLPRRPGEELQ